MRSDYREPLNLGQDRLISINELVDMVASIAGQEDRKRHNLTAPQGVRGRNSDNTRLREVLGWEPSVTLEQRARRRPTTGSSSSWRQSRAARPPRPSPAADP